MAHVTNRLQVVAAQTKRLHGSAQVMAIEQACGLANRLRREAQMLALPYVRFGPTRVAGELPDKPIVGLDGGDNGALTQLP
jgi:hypothetical protein